MTGSSVPSTSDRCGRELLDSFLDERREYLLSIIVGVPAELVGEPLVLPDASLLDIVHHVTALERFWFAHIFAASSTRSPSTRGSARSPAELTGMYRAECARSCAATRRAPLDQLTARRSPSGEHVTLHWILLHMLTETARHAGRAEILRQLIEGGITPRRSMTAVDR